MRRLDVISDAVELRQYASDFYAQRSIAAEDAATCGIGAIVTYLDMTQKDHRGRADCGASYSCVPVL